MGRYQGELTTIWKQDGRLMELKNPFAFIDNDEVIWEVPAGARIDGASIPQFLWSITGSPYSGKYRDASVIHDWFCSIRTRSSHATHKMFYEAMLVSGVNSMRARIMYAAVLYAGPRWTQMDSDNANLASDDRWGSRENYWGPGGLPPYGTLEFAEYEAMMAKDLQDRQEPAKAYFRANVSKDEFQRISEKVMSCNLDTYAIDEMVSLLPAAETVMPKKSLYRFTEEFDYSGNHNNKITK